MKFTKQFGKYTFTATIVEKPDRVEFTTTCVPSLNWRDVKTIRGYQEFLMPLMEKYDTDPRPTVLFDALSGQTITTYGDGNNSFGFMKIDHSKN